MKLYGSKNSRSLRCAWALEEADATYEYQRVNMMKGEGFSPAFKAINPAGKIPVLVDGDLTLTESAAIVMYIAEKFTAARLMPIEAGARAEVFRWIFYVVTEIEPPLWTIAQHRFALPADKRVPAVESTCVWQLQRAFQAIEAALEIRPFIAYDEFSAADIFTTHCLMWALSAKIECSGVASLTYIERMKARPAFQRAATREQVEADRFDALWHASANTGTKVP